MQHQCDIKAEELDLIKAQLITEKDNNDLADLFKMYADSSRLRILNLLFQHELCVHDIAKACNMNHSAVSHQLAKLKSSRIIKSRRSGKNIYYSLDDEHIELIFNNGLEHVKELRNER